MKFADIFKKSFLEGYSNVELSSTQIIIALAIACVISLYIFYTYRIMTRRTFYSKNFNISLVAMCLITAAIIITIQSSVVVSLGMVGALSIVRFRTAIKDPMDLVFLFWSISVGIICGAGLSQISMAVVSFVINNQIMKYSGASALAIYGFLGTVSALFLSVFSGIGQAAQPIVSENYGACQHKRYIEVGKTGHSRPGASGRRRHADHA